MEEYVESSEERAKSRAVEGAVAVQRAQLIENLGDVMQANEIVDCVDVPLPPGAKPTGYPCVSEESAWCSSKMGSGITFVLPHFFAIHRVVNVVIAPNAMMDAKRNHFESAPRANVSWWSPCMDGRSGWGDGRGFSSWSRLKSCDTIFTKTPWTFFSVSQTLTGVEVVQSTTTEAQDETSE